MTGMRWNESWLNTEKKKVDAFSLKAIVDSILDRFGLSTRGFYRVLKVARTLADLTGMEHPKLPQYQESLSYRSTIDKRVGINS